uniref:CUB domain containing protein n=1 Tax=Rhipicephalus zambeziensis TaxID=60191 RepID=A0A224YQR1_9ACAR
MRLAFGALLVVALWSTSSLDGLSSKPGAAMAAAAAAVAGEGRWTTQPETEAELLAKHVCSRYEVRLRCDDGELVAIHDAMYASEPPPDAPPARPGCGPIFETTQDGATVTSTSTAPSPCEQDLRLAINSRCSGEVHCLFSLSRDQAERRCRGEGSLLVRYRCLNERSLMQKCGAHVRSPTEGYLSSPGFPHFYPALSNCSWLLEASPGQTIVLRILDLSIRPPRPGAPGPLFDTLSESDCAEDALSVLESGRPLLVACGESRLSLRTLRSTGRRLVVRFRTRSFVPARGFLLKYKFMGCPTPVAPRLGYLVHRAEETALYKCCKDHMFNDTQADTRALFCIRGNTWNDSVPETCTPRLPVTWNDTVVEEEEEEPLLQGRKERDGDDEAGFLSTQFLADVLVPCLAMVFLLLGNAIVVVIIFKLKKKRRRRLASVVHQPDIALLVPPQPTEPPPWKHG